MNTEIISAPAHSVSRFQSAPGKAGMPSSGPWRVPLLLAAAMSLFFLAAAPSFGAAPSLDEDDGYLDAHPGPPVSDPLESWNRAMFRFNDVVLDNIAKPVYRGYAYVTPLFMRVGLKNFFYNLAFPVRFVNNLLQGRPMAAGVEMSRFVLNTTAGLGGFFDVAGDKESIVPVEDDEDLGQTFAVWGVGEGPYIVWPLLGPSTVRDSIGEVGDWFLDPVSYVRPWGLGLGITAAETFNELDDVLDLYDDLKRAAIEPYSSVRDAYVQYRRAKAAE